MHRTKKGNRRRFGTKLHIGTDPRGLARHLDGTAASVAKWLCSHFAGACAMLGSDLH